MSDERHERMGDLRYVSNPTLRMVKVLRDLHTLFWIAKYLYRCETSRSCGTKAFSRATNWRGRRAQRFLWTVRCHLHYLTARAEERLTFDLQPELAREMGYADREGVSGVERFMKHYFLVAKDGHLTHFVLEARQQRSWTFKLPGLGLFSREVEDFKMGGRLMLQATSIF